MKNLNELKLNVVEYLKYERDERIPELIEMYDGDEQFVIDEIWGPLETCLDGKSDKYLVSIVNEIMDDPSFNTNIKQFQEWTEEDDMDTLCCNYVWEFINNP